MYSGAVLLVVVAILVLLFAWSVEITTEDRVKDEFEKYNREMLFGKSYEERNISEPFELKDNQELLICGINHRKVIGFHWQCKIFNSGTDLYKISSLENMNENDLFWSKTISSQPRKNTINICEPFRINDCVWTKRPGIIHPRVYLITKE